MLAKELILEQKAVSSDSEALLGCLCWWTIRSQIIDSETLGGIVRAANLEGFMPKPLRPAGAFRRATKLAERNTQTNNGSERTRGNDVLVREVDSTKEGILRKMVTEFRNREEKGLSYQETAELYFDRVNGSVLISGADERTRDFILDNYNLFNGRFTAERIRLLVKKVIDSTSPTLIRPSGSVYFIPARQQYKVERLERVIQEINGRGMVQGRPSTLEYMGVLDSEKHREMVLKHFENQTIGQINAFLAEAAEVLKEDQEVRAGTAARFMEDVQRARQAVRTYEDMLEKDLHVCREKVAMAERQALDILARVKEETPVIPRKRTPVSQVA